MKEAFCSITLGVVNIRRCIKTGVVLVERKLASASSSKPYNADARHNPQHVPSFPLLTCEVAHSVLVFKNPLNASKNMIC
jgi:hypothetical protein